MSILIFAIIRNFLMVALAGYILYLKNGPTWWCIIPLLFLVNVEIVTKKD